MASYKTLHLLALLISSLCVGAQQFSHPSNQLNRPSRISDSRNPYEFSASEPGETYSNLPRIPVPIAKKIPRENKNYKKVVSPFYTTAEKHSEDFKSLSLKSGLPHCERISNLRTVEKQEGKNGESMVCYRCKDLQAGATYEQCLLVSEPASKYLRSRRSNPENHQDASAKSSYENANYRKADSPYRFSEEIFADLTEDVPAEYRNKGEKCEKVLKDNMVCMVCEDKKTNGKYEQCSYVRQPAKKAFGYVKSSTSKDLEPRKKEEDDDESSSAESAERSQPLKEQRQESYPQDRYQKSRKEEEKGAEEAEETSDCKEVQKDSQSCMVCKDKKNGGTYEKCSYSYQPNDKVYKFSRSKSFGQPRGSSSKEEKSSKEEPEVFPKYTRDYYAPSTFYANEEEGSAPEYDGEKSSGYRVHPSYDFESTDTDAERESRSSPYKSESEAASEKIDSSNCKKVNKDSMVCEVCKDPKTGNDLERCSYSYEPNDKSYSYSKSKSFGSPTKNSDESSESGYNGEESKESRQYPYSGKTYEFPSERKAYDTSSESKEDFREFPVASETKAALKEEKDGKIADKTGHTDAGFYDTLKKKAEIEKFLEEFQSEDRSNCKKVMRDKMTCYQCVDQKGSQKEECAFVTTRDPTKEKLAYRELKEIQVEEPDEPARKVPRSTAKRIQRRADHFYVEPSVASSQEQPIKEESPESADDESEGSRGKVREIEPFADETRPVYDKVLGLTLPAYMLQVSEHEAEFDETVASGRIQ